MTCTLGSLSRTGELTYEALATPGSTGYASYTARIAWSGEPDSNPEADIATAATTVASCDIVGTWGNDVLVGTSGPDRICGRPGADRITGGAGNDQIFACSGADTVIGGAGRDTIDAGGGGDLITCETASATSSTAAPSKTR
jgi:Ca2+-binding RTX toxin-like protein